MGYLTNFIVYTLAMVGVMMLAVFIFKTSTGRVRNGGSKFIKVLDTMSIAPRKILYVVAVNDEKFLIAGDVDKTTLISKLGSENNCYERITPVMTDESENFSTKSFNETMSGIPNKSEYIDKSITDIRRQFRNRNGVSNNKYNSVMKNLAEKMSTITLGDGK